MNKEKMKESFLETQTKFNLFLEGGIKEDIEEIHVFYEDCKNCPQKEDCPNKEKMMKGGIVLAKLHEVLEDIGLDSNLHPLTSKDNGELGKVVCEKGGVMPVSARLDEEMPVFAPKHNFLVIELEDGRKYLYMPDLGLSDDSDEVKAPLMYG